jgi:hypothetical protein
MLTTPRHTWLLSSPALILSHFSFVLRFRLLRPGFLDAPATQLWQEVGLNYGSDERQRSRQKGNARPSQHTLETNQLYTKIKVLCFAAGLSLHNHKANYLRAASLQCEEEKSNNGLLTGNLL